MSEFDGPWQEALDHFFELFVAFFLPAMHAQIDWSKDYESQDQELQKLAPESELGTRRVDKLVIRGLYERGLDAQDVRHWFRFFDWLLNLPIEMEHEIWTELEREEKEKQMPYITSVERIGIEKGIEQGIEKGLEKGRREGLLQGLEIVLRVKFGMDGVALMPRLPAQTDVTTLQEILKRAESATTVDELRQGFPTLSQ